MTDDGKLPEDVIIALRRLKHGRKTDLSITLTVMRNKGWTAPYLARLIDTTPGNVYTMIRYGRDAIAQRSEEDVLRQLLSMGVPLIPNNTPPARMNRRDPLPRARGKVCSPYAFMSRDLVEDLRRLHRRAIMKPVNYDAIMAFVIEISRLQNEHHVPGPVIDVAIGRPLGWSATQCEKVQGNLGSDHNK